MSDHHPRLRCPRCNSTDVECEGAGGLHICLSCGYDGTADEIRRTDDRPPDAKYVGGLLSLLAYIADHNELPHGDMNVEFIRGVTAAWRTERDALLKIVDAAQRTFDEWDSLDGYSSITKLDPTMNTLAVALADMNTPDNRTTR